MNFTKILVAMDALNDREAAFVRALAIARAAGAELYVLYAVPVNERFSFRAVDRQQRMAAVRQRAEDAGVRVQTVEQHGDAAEIIELHANARGADLIVMGAEPRRGWRRSRSAVAEKVIRRSKVPVLVVASDAPHAPSRFSNVVVAVDLASDAGALLAGAAALTMVEEGARVTVLHAVTAVEAVAAVHSPGRWMVPEYRSHVVQSAREALYAVASDPPAPIAPHVHVATGAAAEAILEHAAQVDADLVVVGRSRGFTMLGSTALRVLRGNHRALLVVPPEANRDARSPLPRAA